MNRFIKADEVAEELGIFKDSDAKVTSSADYTHHGQLPVRSAI